MPLLFPMFANPAASTIFAVVPIATVSTDSLTTTLVAVVTLSTVLANHTPSAFPAGTSNACMLANLTPAAVFAVLPQLAVFADPRSTAFDT
jgi:hypothetical protein